MSTAIYYPNAPQPLGYVRQPNGLWRPLMPPEPPPPAPPPRERTEAEIWDDYTKAAEEVPHAPDLIPAEAIPVSGWAIEWDAPWEGLGKTYRFTKSTNFAMRGEHCLLPLTTHHDIFETKSFCGVARLTRREGWPGMWATAFIQRHHPVGEVFAGGVRPGSWGFSPGATERSADADGRIRSFDLAELSLCREPRNPNLKRLSVGKPIRLWQTYGHATGAALKADIDAARERAREQLLTGRIVRPGPEHRFQMEIRAAVAT